MWIFYSNLILQKSTTEAKIPAKTRRDQPTSRNEVGNENRSRNLKLSLRPKLPKQQVKEVATKEVWSRLKELFKVDRIFGRDTTLMSRRRLKTTEVATSI